MKPCKRRERDYKLRRQNRKTTTPILPSGSYTVEVAGKQFTATVTNPDLDWQTELMADVAKQINASGRSVVATADGNALTITSAPAHGFTVTAPIEPAKPHCNRASRRLKVRRLA